MRRSAIVAVLALFTTMPALARTPGAYIASAAKATEVVSVRADLQALYDEISQAGFQFSSATDVDLFHEVLYTSDWTFIDAAGQPRAWQDVREEVIQSVKTRPYTSMIQAVEKLSLVNGGASVDVSVTTVRKIVDKQGRSGHAGETRTLVEKTMFRDAWVNANGQWKLQTRQQIGQPRVVIEKGNPTA